MSNAVHRLCFFALVFAASATSAVAAEAPPAAGALPVEKFLDETALLVADVDLTSIDVNAIRGWSVSLLKTGGTPAKELEEIDNTLKRGFTQAGQWLDEFRKAGGRRAFVVVTANQREPVFAAIPIGQGTDPAVLTRLLTTKDLLPRQMADAVSAEVVGSHLLFGFKGAVEAAKEAAADPKRMARPDLAAAYVAGGKATHRLAFSLPAQLKSALIIQQPKLPQELGGGGTAPILEGFKYATLTLETPTAASPKIAAKLVIQAADAAAAKRLREVVDALYATAKKEIPREHAGDIETLLGLATPEVAGDKLTLDINQEKYEKAAKPLVLLLQVAREQAARVKSMSNIRQILLASHMYANENKGVMPAKVPEDILRYLVGENNPELARPLLINPANPGKYPGYVYVRPTAKLNQIRNAAQAVMLYEAYDKWPVRGIAVGFADGHAEIVASEEAFKKMLAPN